MPRAPSSPSIALPTALLLIGLVGCGGAPPLPTLQPLPSTTEARADQCGRVAARVPGDLDAQACHRAAMLRLGRRGALELGLRAAREATPADGARWLAEALARADADPDAALALLEQCTTVATDAAWCAGGTGRILTALGRTDEAVPMAESAARARPDLPTFAAWHALALVEAGRREDGRARLAPLLVGWPDRIAVAHATARLAVADGEPPTARAHIDALTALDPDGAAAHVLTARLARSLDQPEQAARALRRAVAADRTALAPRRASARLMSERGRHGAAVEIHAALAEERPDDPRVALDLGEALLAAGEAEQARAWADRARAGDAAAALELQVRATIAAGRVQAALARRDALYTGARAAAHRLAVADALAAGGHVALAESEYAAALVSHPMEPDGWLRFAGWLTARGRLDRAEGLLRQAAMRMPEVAAVHAALADVFERQNNRAGARLALQVAARIAPDEHVHEDELARLEFLDGGLVDALSRWEALIVDHPDADRPLRRLSAAYRALDEPDKAVVLMERLIDRHPHDADLKGRLGETLLEAGRKARAVGVLEDALASGADPDRLRPLLATALADTGRTEDAEALFADALAADPGNRPLRLTFAAFRSATGDRAGAVDLYQAQLARDPSDPDARSGLERLVGPAFVASAVDPSTHPRALVDAELAALAARAPPAIDPEVAGTVLRDERRVVVDDRGVAEVHHRRAILVQRPVGVERFRTATIPFNVDRAPEVVRARTIGPDGEAHGLLSQAVTNPQAGTLLYGDGRELVLTFDRLEVGAIVDYEVITRRPHPDLPDVWWDGYLLGNLEPTVHARYTLVLPQGTALTVKTEALDTPTDTTKSGRRTLVWSRDDLPGYREGAGITEPPPSVRVSSMATWSDVDRWYTALFDPRSAADERVRRTARALTANARNDREKVAAIYAFVERNVRYVGVEFGIGAYQPRPPESTLAQAQGDCKDMTALMVAMLAAVGIESRPALIKPRGQGRFDPEHPSPGQFSHVILHVPKAGLWLDATAGLGTIDAVPAPLRDRHALVVDGRGGRLTTVPTGQPGDHRLTEERTYTLTPTGGGRLTAALELTGDLAGYARQELSAADPAAREAILKAPGHLLEQGRVPDRVQIADLDAPAKPVKLVAELDHRDLVAVRLDGALVLPLDMSVFVSGPRSRFGGNTPTAAGRVFERRIVLVPPKGYRFTWDPVELETDGPIALRLYEERGRDRTTLVSRMTMTGERIDAETRDLLLDAARAVQARLERDLVMMPGPDFDRVAFIEAIIAERPEQPRLKTFLAHALLEADRPLEATMALVEALEDDPTDEQAAALMIRARAEVGPPEEMETRLRRVLDGPAPSPAIAMALAALLVESNREPEAIDALGKVPPARRTPEIESVRLELLMRNGRPADAVAGARDHATRHADSVDAQRQLADLATRADDVPVAEQAWRRVIALQPDDGVALNNLAWLLRDRPAARDEALKLARRATVLRPEDPVVWDTLAELLFRADRIEDALAANAEALRHATETRATLEARRDAYRAARPAN